MSINNRCLACILLALFSNLSTVQGIAESVDKMSGIVSSEVERSNVSLLPVSSTPAGAKGILAAESEDTQVYHIGMSKKDLEGATYAILTGDPGRVEKIASFLQNSKKIAQNREYVSYLGMCNNKPVVVISTGIGGPSTAIAIEELAKLGIKNFIRVGTSGGMQLDVNAGDLVIAKGAVRQEGTSKEYAPIEYPAIADFEVTSALISSAKKLAKESGKKVHIGTVQCKDSFYGQHNPDRMPVSQELKEKWNAWLRLGVKCSEMETAALFVIGDFLGVRTGAVVLVVWNQEQEKRGISQNTDFDTESAIKVVVSAISNLMEEDENNDDQCPESSNIDLITKSSKEENTSLTDEDSSIVAQSSDLSETNNDSIDSSHSCEPISENSDDVTFNKMDLDLNSEPVAVNA